MLKYDTSCRGIFIASWKGECCRDFVVFVIFKGNLRSKMHIFEKKLNYVHCLFPRGPQPMLLTMVSLQWPLTEQAWRA